MITEELLERGLAEAANEYDVPADAVDRIRDQLAPAVDADEQSWRHWRIHRPPRNVLMGLGAASIVLLIVVAIAVGGGGSHGSGDAGRGIATSGASIPQRVNAVGVGGGTNSHSDVTAPFAPAGLPAAKVARPPATGPGSTAGGGTTSSSTSGGAPTAPVQPIPDVPDRIVKTGELDLQVPKGEVSATLDKLTAMAAFVRGYVSDSRTSEGGIDPSGEITLRIPVDRFEDAITRARAITGVKVLALETSAQDVTSRYVDLQARVKALQDTRNVFLTLLAKANTIGETLAVQQHVTDVQTQIEQLQGQIKVLGNQSALSTLTVTVDQKVTPVVAKPHHGKSGLHKAIDRSMSRFVHGIEAIIGIIGPLLLVVLLIAFFWFVGLFGYRILRRRMV